MDKKLILNKLKEHKNFSTDADFARYIGITPQNLRNWYDRDTYDINKLCIAFPEVSADWLLTGEGEMLRVDATASGAEGETKEGVVMVPLLNLDARGGLSANEVTDTAEFVSGQIPFGADLARKGDFAMMITGDSMYPRYPSGSYILLREIPMWREYLELSVPYLLELQDERRVAKIVCKGSDREHYVLKSVNPDFEDTEISVSFIRRVFQVVAMLKKEIV